MWSVAVGPYPIATNISRAHLLSRYIPIAANIYLFLKPPRPRKIFENLFGFESWISSAIDGGNWSDLVNFSEQRFVHIRLLENQKYLSKARHYELYF